jgi:hypothetical protein
MIMLMPLWIITFEIRRHFTPAKKTIYKMENPYKKTGVLFETPKYQIAKHLRFGPT